ncbi:hypothetical protein MAR_036269 [Mya arenaria]|uniref:Uncharacterized protein n=1 Tax=Mya arenaria TaxID=6604 RepID=A0ABY7EMI7_MYAAR|nr:hypothetical protein MAR_036269 [Mya arenaria]
MDSRPDRGVVCRMQYSAVPAHWRQG